MDSSTIGPTHLYNGSRSAVRNSENMMVLLRVLSTWVARMLGCSSTSKSSPVSAMMARTISVVMPVSWLFSW
ncbi:hypothetical protein D3C76_1759780 [compost metagenome]